jgi:tRNA A-37 threonylcarbamoyl transferase component Bud32
MGAMQQTLNSHQHELHALGSTFQSTMKTVKEDLSTEMNESFNKQLSRLEALLEKKQRNA